MDGNNHNSSSSFKPGLARGRKDRLLQTVSGESGGRHKERHVEDLNILVTVLAPLAAVLCYANGLDGAFVHDDVFAIKENGDVTGKAPLSRLLVNDFWGRSMCDNASHKSYRPLTVLTFRPPEERVDSPRDSIPSDQICSSPVSTRPAVPRIAGITSPSGTFAMTDKMAVQWYILISDHKSQWLCNGLTVNPAIADPAERLLTDKIAGPGLHL
ncbi:hypothetical protein ACOMHN_032091 [Nucella lapillus]